jgi:hypothetical protein
LLGLLSEQKRLVDLDVIARAFASPGRVSANHGPCPPVTAAHPRTAFISRGNAHRARRLRVGRGHVETDELLFLVEVSGPKLRRRYTPLKAVWMEIYEPIVTHAKLACRMNLRTRQVELKTTEETARVCAILPPGLGLAAPIPAPGLSGGLTPPTSAAGIGSPLTTLHRDFAHLCHICTGIALAAATSAPGLGSPCHICIGTSHTLKHLRRDLGSPL